MLVFLYAQWCSPAMAVCRSRAMLTPMRVVRGWKDVRRWGLDPVPMRRASKHKLWALDPLFTSCYEDVRYQWSRDGWMDDCGWVDGWRDGKKQQTLMNG